MAPPQCIGCGSEGQTLCQDCSTRVILPFGQRCWRCGSLSEGYRTCTSCRRPGSPRYVWITTNYETIAQRLIQKYKFGHQRAAASSIAGLMSGTFAESPANTLRDYLVVPVPTATTRVRQRGFDHAKLLAREVARLLRYKTSLNALGRLGQTRQVGAIRGDRFKQADNYFVRKPKVIKGKNILLIDDVITTGATLQSVSRLLKTHGAGRVDALVFAKRL